jgi:hydrogenase-4 component F
MPPFNVFLSEFMVVTAGLAAGHLWLTIGLLLLLTVVLGGLVRMVACLLFGDAPPATSRGELGWLTTLPMAILLILMLVMGTHIPQPVSRLLENAASIVMHQSPQQEFAWPWANKPAAAANHSLCTRECAGETK